MPAGINCAPAARANIILPVVPVQFCPVGIAGLVTDDVVIVPLFTGVPVPANAKVDIFNIPADVIVSVPLKVIAPLAVLVPLVLARIRLQL